MSFQSQFGFPSVGNERELDDPEFASADLVPSLNSTSDIEHAKNQTALIELGPMYVVLRLTKLQYSSGKG